jgi:uncharacterized protein YjbJ (UPF0337 family)
MGVGTTYETVGPRLGWDELPVHGRNQMKQSTRDEAQGSVHEVKGNVKEVVGRVTNNPNLEAEGQGEKLGGKIQKKVGQVEKVFEK